jgi:hypothetical protein
MSFFKADPAVLDKRGVGNLGVAKTLVKSIDMGVSNTESTGLGVAGGFLCDARGEMQIMLLSSRSGRP